MRRSLAARLRWWLGPLAAALALASPAAAAPPKEPVVRAELAPETAAATPGGVVHVAVRQTIRPGWHTFWRNPGDSGAATTVAWTLPKGWRAGPIVWPAPERHSLGPLTNYGYTGEVYLPTPIEVPLSARPGETALLKARVSWLVCETLCIPEEKTLELRIPVTAGTPRPHRRFGVALARTLAEAPKPVGLVARAKMDGQGLRLGVVGEALERRPLQDAYFYPYEPTLIDHAGRQVLDRGPEGLTLTLPAAPAAMEALIRGPVAGVLEVGGEVFEVTAPPGRLPEGAGGLGPASGAGRADGLLQALGLAVIGGLILNLMPCVFPVLSMKAAGLARHGRDPAAARVHGLVFMAGVLTTFALLAGALIAARAAGQAIGWGFQLQSPAVVGGLALLMLTVALNLAGVFEVGSGVQHAGSGLASRRGVLGAFFTGALAVVVAAPCTAPFMAGALGYALVQPPPTALLVFLALGFGLALPFTALCFAPRLLQRLPAAGPWMGVLRRVLAIPMLGAALWLAWVFANQAGQAALAGLLVAAVLLGSALWLYGRRQREAAPSGRRDLVMAGSAAGLVLLAGGWLAAGSPVAPAPLIGGRGTVPSQAYSAAALAALRAEGRPVFVNFTADWCVSCKVNERVALSSRKVAQAFERTGVVYLNGDWTARDAEIARALAEHDRSGVPLYLVYPAGRGAPVVLPQLLTEGAVIRALEEAVRTPEAA